MDNNHIGRKISKIRELKGIKQEELARLLNISQQAISRLENKHVIEDDLLNKIAEKLDLSVEGIKQFCPEATINSINQKGGNVYVDKMYYLNSIEEIQLLYEKLLLEKDKTIERLENEIKIYKMPIDKHK